MSTNRDAKRGRIRRCGRSNACRAHMHDLCVLLVRCSCTCHVRALEKLLELLADECDRRAEPAA